jgi:3',5'-cyclic AMP phosphodiesterase CpdA
MFRIVQLSDTHLGATKAHFAANWEPTAAWIRAQRPDLVVHTGDVTVDGADLEEDLSHCAALMRGLGLPFLAVPGNHDVGDAGHLHQPVDDERLSRWERHFGADRWVRDVPGWRLVGINALLFGSGHAREMEQAAWLSRSMDEAQGRCIAWFLHRPFFLHDPCESVEGYWTVRPGQRRFYLDLVARHRVSLVSTGHLHRAHVFERDGTTYAWCPSAGFVVGPREQASMPGEARIGALSIELSNPSARVRVAGIPGTVPFLIDDFIHEVYPPRQG